MRKIEDSVVTDLACDEHLRHDASSRWAWLQWSALLVVLSVLYAETIGSLIRTWIARDDYSHGFLVPLISIYFIYAKRQILRNLSVQPGLILGTVITALGFILLIVGSVAGVVSLQHISILVTIPGIVVLLRGTAYLKALIFPILYLAFMIPTIVELITTKIQWPFQLFSASVSAKMLSVLQVPVTREAQFLFLPDITLEVASACSGINYLISIVALGIPLAMVTQRTNLRKCMLILSSVAVGILLNPIRITLIGLWVYHGGESVHGPFHVFQALFVTVFGIIFLVMFALILSRTSRDDMPHLTVQSPPAGTAGRNRMNLSWGIALALSLCAMTSQFIFAAQPVVLREPLSTIPYVVGNWEGEDMHDSESTFRLDGADSELNRVYRSADGREVHLYIGYFELQRQDKEFITYKLTDLYENAQEITIPLDVSRSMKANKTTLERGGQYVSAIYWYDLNGRIVASNNMAKFLTSLDGMVHRRTNGSFIMLAGNIRDTEESEGVTTNYTEFIRIIMPYLQRLFS